MDSYSSSSSSANYSDLASHKAVNSTVRPPTVRSKLHPVRKIPARDRIMKQPIAPWPRTPPKVYKVSPTDFRDVVQKLTGAPEFQPTRLHEEAPLLHEWFPLPSTPEEKQQQSVETSSFGELIMSPLALSVSPSSLAWSSYVYSLSP